MKKILLLSIAALLSCAVLFTGCDINPDDTLSTKGTTDTSTATEQKPETTTEPDGETTTEPDDGTTTEPDDGTTTEPNGGTTTEPTGDDLNNAGANNEGGWGQLIRP